MEILDPNNIYKRLVNILGDAWKEEITYIAKAAASQDQSETAALALRIILKESNLQKHWNHILDNERAHYLANILINQPGIGDRLIVDFLSGTGTVSKALRSYNRTVIEAENFNYYGRITPNNAWDLSDCRTPDFKGAVAVIITSLHHEVNPVCRLIQLRKAGIEHAIVIENLRTSEFTSKFHAWFDWFFNRVLNEFDNECPGWYWTTSQWKCVLQSFNQNVEWHQTFNSVPGIPFSYDLFTIR